MFVLQNVDIGIFCRRCFGAVAVSSLSLALLAGCANSRSDQKVAISSATQPSIQAKAISPAEFGGRNPNVELNALVTATRVPVNRSERYVVKKGDTLWDIAGHFLIKPWYWPEIWVLNRQVENPHLIYPGDELLLEWRNGRPQLRFAGDLGPRVRTSDLGPAIPLLDADLLRPFLRGPRLVTEQDLQTAPYMLQSVDEHLLASAGDRVYARGFASETSNRWDLLRRNREYRDPLTDELLGIETMFIGTVLLERSGDPAVVMLDETVRPARPGDRLLPPVNLNLNILPSQPSQIVDGQIISVYDGVANIGQYQIVTLNRGTREGLVAGNVLSAYRRGSVVLDTIATQPELVQLPAERAGALLIFQAEERFSYALVMQSTRPLKLGDLARNP